MEVMVHEAKCMKHTNQWKRKLHVSKLIIHWFQDQKITCWLALFDDLWEINVVEPFSIQHHQTPPFSISIPTFVNHILLPLTTTYHLSLNLSQPPFSTLISTISAIITLQKNITNIAIISHLFQPRTIPLLASMPDHHHSTLYQPIPILSLHTTTVSPPYTTYTIIYPSPFITIKHPLNIEPFYVTRHHPHKH